MDANHTGVMWFELPTPPIAVGSRPGFALA